MEKLEKIWPKNEDGSWKVLEELDTLDYILLGEYGFNPDFWEDVEFLGSIFTQELE